MKPSKVFDHMIASMHRCFDSQPDYQSGKNKQYTMKDAAGSTFSVFFTQSPSFLAHRRLVKKGKGESNVETLFGVEQIPSDPHIRNLLDGQETEAVEGLYQEGRRMLAEARVLQEWKGYGGQRLISSKKIHCDKCSTQTPGQTGRRCTITRRSYRCW